MTAPAGGAPALRMCSVAKTYGEGGGHRHGPG